MQNSYSQWSAFKALTWASLKALLKSPSTVAFTIGFPVIFTLVLNYIDFGGSSKISLAVNTNDTDNNIINTLSNNPVLDVIALHDYQSADSLINSGTAKAFVKFTTENNQTIATINHSELSPQELYTINTSIKEALISISPSLLQSFDQNYIIATQKTEIRTFKTIDFILPGQLGFALLASGIFSTAFVFYNLRQSLVLKRFFATPIHKATIILAECASRWIFQIAAAILIICIGYYFLDFHLHNGWISFLNLILVCSIAVFSFLSYGFIVSNIAKNESLIPPLANILTLPQFLLAGTFFSIQHFPLWLQNISNVLPLTHFNNALRKIAFDGVNLWQVKWEISIILLWGILGFIVSVKIFKWE